MLSIKQVTERYKVARSTIYRWVEHGLFPKPVTIGGTVRWREEDLATFDEKKAEAMQLDERELQETIAEAKARPEWTTDRDMILELLREQLGLPDDANDAQLLSTVVQFLEAVAKVKNMMR